MSESDFGRKTTGGRRGGRHTTTKPAGGHTGHGHDDTHAKREQTHQGKQTRHNERKGEMKGKTLTALIGMLFGAFLFFGGTTFAATGTFDTSGAGDTTFSADDTTFSTRDTAEVTAASFTDATKSTFTNVTPTGGGTGGIDFSGLTDIGADELTRTKCSETGREPFGFTTFKFGEATGASTFTEATFAFGGNTGGFTDGTWGFSARSRS